jgi:hypothetical protein
MTNKPGALASWTEDAKAMIDALVDHLKITESAIVQMAVRDYYQAVLGDHLTTLIPREENQYDVQTGGKTIATVCKKALKYVPDEMMKRFLTCGEYAGYTMILLSAAKAGVEITTYE